MKADWLQRSLAFECKLTRIFKIISSSASPLSYSAYCGIGHWKVTVHFVSRLSLSFLACWLCSPPPTSPPIPIGFKQHCLTGLALCCLIAEISFWVILTCVFCTMVPQGVQHAFLLLVTLTWIPPFGYLDMHASYWLPCHAFILLVNLTCMPPIGYLDMHASYWLPCHAFLLLVNLTCMPPIGYLEMHASYWLPWHAFLLLITLTCMLRIGYLDMHSSHWLPWHTFLLLVTLTCICSIGYLDLYSFYLSP